MSDWEHYTCAWNVKQGVGRTVAVPVGWENSPYLKDGNGTRFVQHKICYYGVENPSETVRGSLFLDRLAERVKSGLVWKVNYDDV